MPKLSPPQPALPPATPPAPPSVPVPLPVGTGPLVRMCTSLGLSTLTIMAALCLLAVWIFLPDARFGPPTPATLLVDFWDTTSSTWYLPPAAALILLHRLSSRTPLVALSLTLAMTACVLVSACGLVPYALRALSSLST